ncbi:DUF3618 domain-containing protein [Streptomyces roseus]|uniref:Alanine-rich protein n=1 Tax=Streptomyces roseus TaxID=66430 RepID=A0A0J7AI96_9ACTN|nr:DUF3618 domain-containing protein [Streptomyces roseus]KMO96846.1 hypothetical protein ACS04_15590 [Streptomyces roseus]
MNDDARTNIGTPAPAPTPGDPGSAELRDQVERTRDELGKTVEALAAKADVKAQAKEKAALVSDQIREKAGDAAQLVKDKTPDPLLEKADQAATAARANRTPLLLVGAAAVVLLLIRRSRGRRR